MVLTSNAPLGHMLCGKVFEWFRDGLGRFLNAEAKIKRTTIQPTTIPDFMFDLCFSLVWYACILVSSRNEILEIDLRA